MVGGDMQIGSKVLSFARSQFASIFGKDLWCIGRKRVKNFCAINPEKRNATGIGCEKWEVILKRGLIFLLLFSFVLPQCSFAFSWQDLWFTKNQQAAKLYSKGEMKRAANQFSNSLWSGIANYRSGQYKKAIKAFSKKDTPLANYNRGNAFVHAGDYQKAIAAYDRALKQDPNLKDARYNKKLLEKLLKQQPQKSKNSSNQSNSKQKDKGDSKEQSSANSSSNSSDKNREEQNSQNQTNQTNQANNANSQSSQQQSSEQSKDQNQSQPQQKQQQQQGQQQQQEQQQALKQWLQQIPDNPGGLLREKFLRDHWRLQMKGQTHANE